MKNASARASVETRVKSHHSALSTLTRRQFLGRSASIGGGLIAGSVLNSFAQTAGDRPPRAAGVTVLNPRHRVPVGLIIDDSTCLVNLNRFAMPQFDTAFVGAAQVYKRDWREWPVEIPDSFVRKFGEWCAGQGEIGRAHV